MSKTLAGILEIGAGIGLQFVPGGQAIGKQLILAGVTTELGALLGPKAPRIERPETSWKVANTDPCRPLFEAVPCSKALPK